LAAKKSLAEGVIQKLPNGYDQMRRRFETGVDLSGGEWQKSPGTGLFGARKSSCSMNPPAPDARPSTKP
jgi:hypothetical protein